MDRNNLFPIFIKANCNKILIVGGGNVAEEKLKFLLKSSPDASVTIVSPMFRENTLSLVKSGNVTIINDSYKKDYLKGMGLIVATTDDPEVNIQIWRDCKSESKLINVADNPTYCDFYLGGIVTKGNLKVAISSNGKSPTITKRVRQFFEEVIPENIDELVNNLHEYRKTIKGDFAEKVETLNEFTKGLIEISETKND
jgi:precorrin-2 dehydrogenase / sirohydrochlorin ferrochelatase